MSRRGKLTVGGCAAVIVLPVVAALAVNAVERRRVAALRDAFLGEPRELSFETRPALRGATLEGDVWAEVDNAYLGVLGREKTSDEEQRSWGFFDREVRKGRRFRWSPELEPMWRQVGPAVERIRRALAHDRVAHQSGGWNASRYVLQLAALRALGARQGGEAGRIATDLWQHRHDRARQGTLGGLGEPPDPPTLVALALPLADAAGLDDLSRDLAMLEATLPSPARRLRAEHRWALADFTRFFEHGDPSEHGPATIERPLLGVHTLRRSWEAYDGVHRRLAEVLASAAPWHEKLPLVRNACAEWSRDYPEVEASFSNLRQIVEETAMDLAFLHVTRTLVVAERFRREKGRWPRQEECPSIDDPFDGKPIRVRTDDRGLVVYSLGFDLTDDRGDLAGNHDLGLVLAPPARD